MRILLIDNYDSFTYNIVDALRSLTNEEVDVLKNDEVTPSIASTYDKLIISPGPATPSESGYVLEVIDQLKSTHSILGICLGHQAIAQCLGATLVQLDRPRHGYITHLQVLEPHAILPSAAPIQVGLYHSWTVSPHSLPDDLVITSLSTEGHIMSLRHRHYDLHGVQFHPESYMTPQGNEMLQRFLTHINH